MGRDDLVPLACRGEQGPELQPAGVVPAAGSAGGRPAGEAGRLLVPLPAPAGALVGALVGRPTS
ncbi:hypothetical protein [Cyanobium sp. ATX-6F1]|uniref:hypothetical protein n=1 Tax=Cyanobium sp. ATX-6F1 TaxID=3137388 RepID=UPI0039BE1BE2